MHDKHLSCCTLAWVPIFFLKQLYHHHRVTFYCASFVPTRTFFCGVTPGNAHGLLLSVLGGPYGMPGIEPRSAVCKASTLPAVLSLRPLSCLPLVPPPAPTTRSSKGPSGLLAPVLGIQLLHSLCVNTEFKLPKECYNLGRFVGLLLGSNSVLLRSDSWLCARELGGGWGGAGDRTPSSPVQDTCPALCNISFRLQ